MKTVITLLALFFVLSASTMAQDAEWASWDKKNVDKILNESAWTQTGTATVGGSGRSVQVKYRVRLFSAKPIREAFARTIMLSKPTIKAEQMNGFVNGDYSESIIIALTPDASDRQSLGPILQKLGSITTDSLKNAAYIERADGKRLMIEDYAKPTSDGTGAKFAFARLADGKPWIAGSDSFRFVAELGDGVKIDTLFKLADMAYRGATEY